jgi:hypothetical protein
MWPCWSRVVAGASNRSERQSAETPERRRAGRGQSCTPREAAPRPSAPAVRRARARRGTPRTRFHTPPRVPWCGAAPTQSLPTSPTSLTRPCAPSRTGGPRGRAAAGERTRARHDPARDSGLGLRPGPRSTRAARELEFATRPHAERRRYEPPNPARHGVRSGSEVRSDR